MSTSIPSSWQYGSFYGNSRLYINRPSIGGSFSEEKPQPVRKELVNEDYYRALNEYKQIHKPKEEKKYIDEDKAVSVILHESPQKLTFSVKDNADCIVLPRETVYMIDRVVRQRTSRANLPNYDEFNEDSESKTPENSYKNAKKTSKSVNYDNTEDEHRHTSGHKSQSNKRDISATSKSAKKKLTYEDWYR